MAVELINSPIGHKLATTQIEAVINDYAGDAIVYVAGGHTLSDGDYVYIESNFDAYNGFKYVDSIAYDHFKIKESEGGDYVEFKQEADIIFYVSDLDHGFQCVHLPIVYELESDLWPINVAEEEYTANVIDSFQDYNGYVQLNLDRALDNPVALEYINLIPPIDSYEIQGPYQIIQVLHDWAIVINLAYDSTFDFSNYEIQKYYNNYFITVNVYGGLPSGHRWYAEKPFELLATLKFIPDSDGRIKFSISEILKGQIITRNNLTLDTLPNNLDFYTQFYISYSESYDTSDGSEITVYTSGVTTDSFIGHALNSILPFKSLNQGHLSDYVNYETQQARWLTTQDRAIGLVGYFFDLSFINQYENIDIEVTVFKSLNDIVTDTEVIEILNPGQGIIRVPLEIEAGFDQYCVQVSGELEDDITLPGLSTFLNVDVPSGGNNWTLGGTPNLFLVGSSDETSRSIVGLYSFIAGSEYTLSYYISSSQSWNGSGISLRIFDNSNNVLDIESYYESTTPAGTIIRAHTFIAPSGATKFGLSVNRTPAASPSISTYTLLSIIGTIAGQSQNITEQICIDIVDDCNTFINDNLRLTEGGQFRELE